MITDSGSALEAGAGNAPEGVRRDWIAAGAAVAFVGLVLAGNSLSLSGVHEVANPTDGQLQAALEQQATGRINRLGLGLELLGMSALALLAGRLAWLLRSTGWGPSIVVGAASFLGLKLGSAAPMAVALSERATLDPSTARVLVAVNDAAFVVGWLPFALFVGAAALGARAAGTAGRLLTGSGLAIAALGVLAAVAGVPNTDGAVPVPFLLSLLWVAALGLRVGAGRRIGSHRAGAASEPARA